MIFKDMKNMVVASVDAACVGGIAISASGYSRNKFFFRLF